MEKFEDPCIIEIDDNTEKEKIALTKEQEIQLLNKAKERNYKHYLMILLALNTSLRVNELINLIVPNLVFEEEPFIVIQDRPAGKYNGSFKCKSKFSNRRNPISENIADLLRAYLKNRKTGYIFQSQKKLDFGLFDKSSAIRMINRYALKCPSIGRKIGFHTTRRTYASKLLDANVPINQISLALGHSDIKTTMIYLKATRKLDMNLIREAISK